MENKVFTKPFIRGISVVVPKKRIAIKDMPFPDVNLDDVIKITGIHEIRESEGMESQTDYCINAAEKLMTELNIDKSQIDGVIFSTPCGDYISPGSAYIVQKGLKLKKNCVLLDDNQACAGFIHGLFHAFLYVQSGYCKNVLVCSGETTTKGIGQRDKSMRVLMGDAGAVAIISANDKENKTAFGFYNDGEVFKALYTPAGGKKLPWKHGITDVEETDENGNIRTLRDAHMDGLEVMAFAISAVPNAVKDALKALEWKKDEVNLFALHQANETLLRALTKRLRVPTEKVPVNLKQYGNTAGASIPLLLNLLAENHKASGNWEKVVMCGFGNGMSCAAAALDLNNTYFSGVHDFDGVVGEA